LIGGAGVILDLAQGLGRLQRARSAVRILQDDIEVAAGVLERARGIRRERGIT
jgi:hypothetical protein